MYDNVNGSALETRSLAQETNPNRQIPSDKLFSYLLTKRKRRTVNTANTTILFQNTFTYPYQYMV